MSKRTINRNLELSIGESDLLLGRKFNYNMVNIDVTMKKVEDILDVETITYEVNGATGNDDYDGLTKETAFKTIDKAFEVGSQLIRKTKEYIPGLDNGILTNLYGFEPWVYTKAHVKIKVATGAYFLSYATLLDGSICFEIEGTFIDPDLSSGSGGPIAGTTTAASGQHHVTVDLSAGTPWNDNEIQGMMIKFDGYDNYFPIRKNTDIGGGVIQVVLPYYMDRSASYPANTDFTLHDFGTAVAPFREIESLTPSRKTLNSRFKHIRLDYINFAALDVYECYVATIIKSGTSAFLSYFSTPTSTPGQTALMCIFNAGRPSYVSYAHCSFDCIEARTNTGNDLRNYPSLGPQHLYCYYYGNTILGPTYNVVPLRSNGFSDVGLYKCYMYDNTKIKLDFAARAYMLDCRFEDTFLGIDVTQNSFLRVRNMYTLGGAGTIAGAYLFDIKHGSKVIYDGGSAMQLYGATSDYRINPAVTGNLAPGLLDASNGCLIQEF